MFIRKKRISGIEYAYLVRNSWTEKGSRQKSTKYLGKVFTIGDVRHEYVEPDGQPKEYLRKVVSELLVSAKFTRTDEHKFSLGEITVDLEHLHVRRKTRPVVLEINEGFLCDMTLHNLMLFATRKYSVDLQEKQLHPGHVLAQRLVEIGLKIAPEQFILTFEYLVPNADVLLRYMSR